MGKKNIILIILCAIVAFCTLSVFIINVFDIKFNFVTYHSFEQDGYLFSFKGSHDTVRKMIIKKDSKKLCSLPFDSTSEIFENEFGFSAIFSDLNQDSKDDIILPCALDSDGDIHYSAFLADSSDSFISVEGMNSLSNISIDEENGYVLTNEITKEILAEGTDTSPEFYVLRHSIARHGFENGKFITLEERAVTYYSENDYYCYSIYEHDEAFGGLKYVDEIWFEPSELGKYPLDWN